MPASKFKYVPWKRNLLKVPTAVLAKLASEPDRAFAAGVVKSYPRQQLERGLLSHLGIGVIDGKLILPERALPRTAMGRYSTNNREGWEEVRKDLPKVWETFYFEVPNFGDWSKGSHIIGIPRQVYLRDRYDPPGLHIIASCLQDKNDEVVLKLTIDFKLERKSADYNTELLFALNLLQENLGAAGIVEVDADTEALLSTLGLDWEIFPPGTADIVVRKAIARMRRPNAEQEDRIRERVGLFNSLKPKHFLQGQGGLNSYIGALFADDLVVFENVRYGNALYVLFADWAEVSKRSRIDLLRNGGVPFMRFVHSEDWSIRFKKFIRDEKKKRGLSDDDSSSDRGIRRA